MPAKPAASLPRRPCLPLAGSALLTLSLGGCAVGQALERQMAFEADWVARTATTAVTSTQALAERQIAGLSGGDVPSQVRPLMGLPLTEVGRFARFGSAWHRFEFARRLETGFSIAKDEQCAAHWYRVAAETPRPFGRTYATEPLGSGETGIVQSQVALRRLEARNWTVAYALTPSANAYGDITARCVALVFENPAFARPPSPQW